MGLRATTLVFLLPLFTAGCDVFGNDVDNTIDLTGRVVQAETAEPIVGLGVTLDRGLQIGRLVVARTRTDSGGVFRIVYDASGSRSTHALTLNDEPHDPRYSVWRTSVTPGTRRDLGLITLEAQ